MAGAVTHSFVSYALRGSYYNKGEVYAEQDGLTTLNCLHVLCGNSLYALGAYRLGTIIIINVCPFLVC